MPSPDPASNGWHLDRRVPLALIVTIIIQTAGVFWWAANITSRVEALEKGLSLRTEDHDRITRLETNQVHILEGLRRIETRISGGQP